MFFKRKVGHPTTPGIYNFHHGRIFTNGAEDFTFGINRTLPLFDVIGPATNAGQLAPTQPPQVWQTQGIGIVGLGGLQAGFIVSQPLVNDDLSPVE